MQNLQQSVFLNLSRVSHYKEQSKVLHKPHNHYPKYRYEELSNQFQLVDFTGTGRLSKKEIVTYLQQKYQWVNLSILRDLFQKMKWDEKESVDKDDFCKKYISKERQLYHQINQLASYEERLATIQSILSETKKYKPFLYGSIRINKIYFKQQENRFYGQQWVDVQVQYEDHKNKLYYKIEQPSYEITSPSFEILLPVQDKYFFVRYNFLQPKFHSNIYGNCYVNIPIPDEDKIKKVQKIRVDITKNNQILGYCQLIVVFESDIKKIELKIEQESNISINNHHVLQNKRKEFEYLQFLFGIRHKSPDKISELDVKWIVILRVILICMLAILSLSLHVLGRCEPISFIICLILIKNWKYVILRTQKFLLTWLAIFGITLDIIWYIFASNQMSQINFMKISASTFLTLILIVNKVLLLLYLLFVEKSFNSEDQNNRSINDDFK